MSTDPLDPAMTPDNLPVHISTKEAEQIISIFDNPLKRIRTSLDIKNPRDAVMVVNAVGPEDYDLVKAGNTSFFVRHWFASLVPITIEETGEVRVVPRVVLINPDGKKLAWTSEITSRYWGLILAAKGNGPWEPPIEVIIGEEKGKKQGHWYPLSLPVLPVPEQKGAKK